MTTSFDTDTDEPAAESTVVGKRPTGEYSTSGLIEGACDDLPHLFPLVPELEEMDDYEGARFAQLRPLLPEFSDDVVDGDAYAVWHGALTVAGLDSEAKAA